MSEVLLLDGDARSTLAVCRSLGKRGVQVLVAGPRGCLTHASRYCSKQLLAPRTRNPGYRRWLEDVVLRREIITIPMTDLSLEAALSVPALARFIPFSSAETVDAIQDKSQLLVTAASLGIATPRTEVVTAGSKTDWDIFPAVLKDAKAEHVSALKKGVKYLSSRDDLISAISEIYHGVEFHIQERIDGEGIGVFLLAENGETLVSFAHRRILEKPPSGGVSVLSESIPLSQAPVEQAQALLKKLGYSGIAMVEFKRRGDEFVLMEINPRFWGSLQLSISCGVDFPHLLWLWKTGELTPEHLAQTMSYETGRRLRWDLGCLDHLFIRVKKEGLRALPRILKKNELHFFSGHPTSHETFSRDDVRPFLNELRRYLNPSA